MKDKVRLFFGKIGIFDKLLLIFVIFGASTVFIGLFRGILQSSQVQIEYVNKNLEVDSESKIFVDIEGAVKSPGVYELASNSRVKDILVLAGGYSEKADREYCEKTINLASLLKDGQKIYIPFISDTPSALGYSVPDSSVKLININTATDSELDTLWGIGAARIETIVKNRPYQNIEELVTKKIFTKQIMEKNKDRVVVY